MIKHRIAIVDYTVVIRTYNHDVRRIVIEAFRKIVDVVCMNQCRPVSLADKLSAYLASITVQYFQAVTNCLREMPNFFDSHRCYYRGVIVRCILKRVLVHSLNLGGFINVFFL